MKISKSKQELARIISENGGWRDMAEWAAQDSRIDDFQLRVCFYANRPFIQKGESRWIDGNCRPIVGSVDASHQIKNWHQTILSREEYFHLYPATDARPEFCESVMRSIPDPEAKPTIEQLAADYLAKLDIATLAQEEADAHRCGAEVALGKLEIALKDLGFKIEPITAKQEPELVITDWRDLRVGDEIEYLDSSCSFTGLVGTVELIDYDEGESYHILFRHGDRGVSDDPAEWVSTRWCREFRFIRRP